MGDLIKRLLATVGAGVYALSPIDIIPDFIPILGLTDDIAVIVLLVYYWLSWIRDQERERQSREAAGDGRGPVIDITPGE